MVNLNFLNKNSISHWSMTFVQLQWYRCSNGLYQCNFAREQLSIHWNANHWHAWSPGRPALWQYVYYATKINYRNLKVSNIYILLCCYFLLAHIDQIYINYSIIFVCTNTFQSICYIMKQKLNMITILVSVCALPQVLPHIQAVVFYFVQSVLGGGLTEDVCK